MEKLFRVANRYCKESSWKILALLKICLFSLGVLAGMLVPHHRKKTVVGLGLAAFAATYVPLMAKLLRTWKKESQEEAI